MVAGLVPNGPGARSGVQEGDVIVGLDAREVPTRKDLYLSLWRHAPGEKIAIEVMRDNELRVVRRRGRPRRVLQADVRKGAHPRAGLGIQVDGGLIRSVV